MAVVMMVATLIHDGFYTVVGHHGRYTFRIRTNAADAAFAPRKQVIGYLAGPANESDYIQFGFVIDGKVIPWKRFQSGYERILAAAHFLVAGKHDEFGKLYAMESGNCYICNRTLTTPESVLMGIGPTCAGRM